ncbi:MAG: hypothetical protein MUO64_08400 [Anaerolineales bacterium]|nr:hypothetical protein [Anaerolineales bacterium]
MVLSKDSYAVVEKIAAIGAFTISRQVASVLAELMGALHQETGAKTWEEWASRRIELANQAIDRVRTLAKDDLKVD